MAGDFGAPYRAPCGGWPAERQWFFGGPFQHRIEGDASIQRYRNSTTVPDYHLPAGDPIKPYPRLDDRHGWPDTGTCPGPGTQPNPNCASVTAGAQPCGPWYQPGSVDDRPAGATDHNSYAEAVGTTVDRSACHKVGFKNVQARKYWHGRFGYLSHDPAGRSDRKVTADCGCNYEFEQAAPDTTKYRTVSLHCEKHLIYYYRGEIASDDTAASDRTASVGRDTGVVSQTVCSDTGDVDLQPGVVATLMDHVNINASASMTWYAARLALWAAETGWTVTESFAGGVYSATATDADANTRGSATLNCSTGALEMHEYTAAGAEILIETASWTNTAFTHSVRSWVGDSVWPTIYSGTEGNEIATTTTGALDDAYTSAMLVSNITDLLAEWDLADDVVYPWRHDELCCIGPLVSRNEVQGNISPENGITSDCGYTDPLAPYYDGAILGAPLSAGYGPHFDFEHESWRVCKGEDGERAYYRYAYGQWATARDPDGAPQGLNDHTDEVVPETATRWTWNYGGVPIAGDVPSGAWMIYQPSTGALIAQKWAEIKVLRPSYNFARPCGGDRYLLEESAVGCAQDLGGNVLGVNPDLPAPAAGDKYLVRGLGALDGVWEVTRPSAGHFHLDTRIAAATLVPAGDEPILGKLRFPTAPAICGRVAVTAASNATPIEITLDSPASWWTGDQVTIAGALGNTAANGTHTITVIDSTHATLDGVAGNGDYTGGAYATSPDAADYQWYDDQHKGDYYLLEWAFNYRDWRERQRVIDQADNETCAGCPDLEPADRTEIRPNQAGHGMPRSVSAITVTEDCLPFKVCCPQIIAISPNGEEWTNGTTYPFGAFAADERYGAAWQAAVVQELPDPLWQAPHKGCVDGESGPEPNPCDYIEDDGSCLEDTCVEGTGIVYYAHRPMVEARASVPDGAPALPTGYSIHVLTIAELNSGSPPDGLVMPPPVGLGYVDADNGADPCLPVSAVTPWGTYLRELSCVCNAGAFAVDYQANWVNC